MGCSGSRSGSGRALILPHLITNPVAISVPWILLAIGVAIAIGVGFGVYPAGPCRPTLTDRRAAQ